MKKSKPKEYLKHFPPNVCTNTSLQILPILNVHTLDEINAHNYCSVKISLLSFSKFHLGRYRFPCSFGVLSQTFLFLLLVHKVHHTPEIDSYTSTLEDITHMIHFTKFWFLRDKLKMKRRLSGQSLILVIASDSFCCPQNLNNIQE